MFWDQWSNENNLGTCTIWSKKLFSIRITLIPKWSKCSHQTAINVVRKQQAIPKWFKSLKWSTSAYKKVTKRPSWNLKVVPKWSQSSQQMIQKWSPSNHQITKRSPSSNQMVHRLCQSDHEMVTRWSNFKQSFWLTAANISSQFIHLCLSLQCV